MASKSKKFGNAGRQMEVHVDGLLLHKGYQRMTRTTWVRDMAKEGLDERRFGRLIVCEWEGKLYVIDGGHRLILAKTLEYTHIPCIVHSGVSPKEQAKMFVSMNTGHNVTPVEKWQALLYAGDEFVTEANKIMERHGWFVGITAGKNCTRSASTVRRIHVHGLLSDTLAFIRDLWDSEEGRLKGKAMVLGGAMLFFATWRDHPNALPYNSMIKKLKARSLLAIEDNAVRSSRAHDNGQSVEFAYELCELYNRSLKQENKLLTREMVKSSGKRYK